MKRIVDIPDEMIKALEQGCFGAKYNMFDFVGYVLNGTELPKEHGRLIDADAYKEEMLNSREFDFFKRLDMQPTIIEADKGRKRREQ